MTLEKKNQNFMHTKIWQAVISKIGYAIQDDEFVPLPPKRVRKQRNNNLHPSFSSTLKIIRDEQKIMNATISKLVRKIEKMNLISPMVSSGGADNEMN